VLQASGALKNVKRTADNAKTMDRLRLICLEQIGLFYEQERRSQQDRDRHTQSSSLLVTNEAASCWPAYLVHLACRTSFVAELWLHRFGVVVR